MQRGRNRVCQVFLSQSMTDVHPNSRLVPKAVVIAAEALALGVVWIQDVLVPKASFYSSFLDGMKSDVGNCVLFVFYCTVLLSTANKAKTPSFQQKALSLIE